eukprot:2074672-Prymnesium_polylepis.1
MGGHIRWSGCLFEPSCSCCGTHACRLDSLTCTLPSCGERAAYGIALDADTAMRVSESRSVPPVPLNIAWCGWPETLALLCAE